VQSPLQILQGATIHAARLMKREGQIGQIVAGAYADLLMVDGDPLRDATLLGEPQKTIKLLMQGGRIVPGAAEG
jgi:imidazolonepropionase-like amidohydrolase